MNSGRTRRLSPSALIVGVSLCLVTATGSHAQGRAVPAPPKPTDATKPELPKPVPLARQSMDQLFERLAAAKSPEEAKGISSLIQRRWSRSGSDTADLLMSRAQEAMKAKELALAVELLDRLIAIEPGWAEGWNQRANAFFLMDDSVRSLFDLAEALKREPRHFGALGGLGSIMRQQGQDKLALQALRKALSLHPQMDGVKEQVERLARDLDGRDI